MYGYESWTIKKAEPWRIDDFELWCWRRLLRVPWTARKSNESILKEISPEYSLEGLMLKLKLQYFGHLMQRTDSLEKTLMLGKIEGRRRRGWQRMRWLDGVGWSDSWTLRIDEHEFEQAPGVSDGQGSLVCCSSLGLKELDMTEGLDWTAYALCGALCNPHSPRFEAGRQVFAHLYFSSLKGRGLGMRVTAQLPLKTLPQIFPFKILPCQKDPLTFLILEVNSLYPWCKYFLCTSCVIALSVTLQLLICFQSCGMSYQIFRTPWCCLVYAVVLAP